MLCCSAFHFELPIHSSAKHNQLFRCQSQSRIYARWYRYWESNVNCLTHLLLFRQMHSEAEPTLEIIYGAEVIAAWFSLYDPLTDPLFNRVCFVKPFVNSSRYVSLSRELSSPLHVAWTWYNNTDIVLSMLNQFLLISFISGDFIEDYTFKTFKVTSTTTHFDMWVDNAPYEHMLCISGPFLIMLSTNMFFCVTIGR